MQIRLANGAILEPLTITGSKRTVQGALRDTLQFVFPATVSMEELDAAFSEENCATIAIVGANSETVPKVVEKEIEKEDGTKEIVHETEYETVATDAIYKNYSLRCELKKEAVTIQKENSESAIVTEERVFVSMSQKTYTEMQLQSITETVDFLVLDSLM